MITWRIYYMDGTTFDNTQGDVYDAPYDGVICIVCLNEKNNRRTLNAFDVYYYVKSQDSWLGSQHGFAIWRLAKHSRNYVAPKIGETHPDDSTYEAIMKKAHEDRDFPKRAGGLDILESPRNTLFKGVIVDG